MSNKLPEFELLCVSCKPETNTHNSIISVFSTFLFNFPEWRYALVFLFSTEISTFMESFLSRFEREKSEKEREGGD